MTTKKKTTEKKKLSKTKKPKKAETKKKKSTPKKKSPPKKKKKGGRPSKLPTIDLKKVELLAQFGLNEKQICQVIGIARSTFNLYKKKKGFSDTIKRGRLVADLEVVKSLYKRAVGYKYDEVTREPVTTIVETKGKKEKIVLKKELIVTKIVTKHVVPDVGAQIYWTKNRMKKKQGYEDDWRDKQEVEHSGDVGDGGRTELIAGLVALQEKDKQKILKVIRGLITKKK